jgi:hypothetical protein
LPGEQRRSNEVVELREFVHFGVDAGDDASGDHAQDLWWYVGEIEELDGCAIVGELSVHFDD